MGNSSRRMTIKKVPRKGGHKTGMNGSGSGRSALNSKKTAARTRGKNRSRQSSIILPDGYRPSESEPFMNERHRIYFRNKLVAWKEEIVRQNRETLHILVEDSAQHADLADRATSETDRALELRARDRQRKRRQDRRALASHRGESASARRRADRLKRLDAALPRCRSKPERHERREGVPRRLGRAVG
jgi:DnaK suppressor protein